MPENKKHHFVPQFYLRNFSNDGKSIAMFNFNSGKIIQSASIADQCAKNDFYLYKEREKALGLVEDALAPIIKSIIEDGFFPKRFSEEHILLLQFICLQLGRTEAIASENQKFVDKFLKEFTKDDPKLKHIDMSLFKIELTDPTELSLTMSLNSYPLLFDMGIKYIIANSQKSKFITSDQPVVLFNQYSSSRKSVKNLGFALKGLQIFFPISPDILIFLFDMSVYKVGKNNSFFFELANDGDIDTINKLQIYFALKNLYFNQSSDFPTIKQIATCKSIDHITSQQSLSTIPAKTKGKYIEFSVRHDIPISLKIKDIKIMKSAKKIPKLQRESCIRSPTLVKHFEYYNKEIEDGNYGFLEFEKYVCDKQLEFTFYK